MGRALSGGSPAGGGNGDAEAERTARDIADRLERALEREPEAEVRQEVVWALERLAGPEGSWGLRNF